ncbi:MAG: hypothetical protein O3A92_11810 [Verrucomicrobia bacterium]|nr:hypothetical protein [Verrucomicrobiota bacterium]
MRLPLLLLLTTLTSCPATEESLTFQSTPGCFTGSSRLLTATSSGDAWLQRPTDNGEWSQRKPTGKPTAVIEAFAAIKKISFSDAEIKLLTTLSGGVIGPERFTVALTLEDNEWSISYLSDMTIPALSSLYTEDQERDEETEKQVRDILSKIQMIHQAITPLLPPNNK